MNPGRGGKHALLGFSRGVARDLPGTGIRILVPCPRMTDTGFFESGPGEEELAPVIEQLRDSMDRPSAVAKGILYQLNSESMILFPTVKPEKAFTS
jgi:short-subunit dehydrogenase